MTVRGIDVSDYQRPSQWRAMSPEFVFIKATEGCGHSDTAFAGHLQQAGELHALSGAYHFGWPINDVQAEANHFAAAVSTPVADGRLRMLALDLEPYPDRRNVAGLSAGHIHDWASRWLAFTRAKFPHTKIGIYADLDTIGHGWVPGIADFYWVAEYRGGMTYSRAEAGEWPKIGPGYPAPAFWQFNSSPLDMDLGRFHDAVALHHWAAAPAPAPKPGPPPGTYTVVAGDTLSGIAVRHGISLAALEAENPQVRNPDMIHVGQALKLPAGARELPKATTYKVRKGDTLSKIAAAHGISLTSLERSNPQVRNPNLVMIGQVLTIPARG